MAGDVRKPVKPLTPDAYERIIATGSIVLLVAVLAALARGHAEWERVPWVIWPHLLTIMIALALTPTMLLRRRGDRWHRMLGIVWVMAMLLTAASSFAVRLTNHGGFSLIHLLSAWTLVQAPIIWRSARRHDIARHRRAVRAMVTGALLIAGFFTFPFHRLLRHWLFG